MREIEESISAEITRVLIKMGISCAHSGFAVIRRSVLLSISESRSLTEAYSHIAKQENKVESAIKASIRNAIKCGYTNTRFKYVDELFGGEVWPPSYPVTMTEFMSVICEYFKTIWPNGTYRA